MLTIIDDISSKVKVFFIMQKSDLFTTFNEWKIMIDKQI